MKTENTKWIYENDYNNTVRYILGTKGKNPFICFGINPSTAEPDNLDNTLKTVERFAGFNNFDCWIMFNIYPQRATNPNDIHNEINDEIHQKNLDAVKKTLAQFPDATIWAAWGTLIEKRPFLMNCLYDIYKVSLKHNCQWVSFGKISKKGHPHHPLYLRNDTKPEGFDINLYIEKFNVTI